MSSSTPDLLEPWYKESCKINSTKLFFSYIIIALIVGIVVFVVYLYIRNNGIVDTWINKKRIMQEICDSFSEGIQNLWNSFGFSDTNQALQNENIQYIVQQMAQFNQNQSIYFLFLLDVEGRLILENEYTRSAVFQKMGNIYEDNSGFGFTSLNAKNGTEKISSGFIKNVIDFALSGGGFISYLWRNQISILCFAQVIDSVPWIIGSCTRGKRN